MSPAADAPPVEFDVDEPDVGRGRPGAHEPDGGRRVLVVGGGITGLAAALHLAESPDAPRVVLAEAADRLGGKIVTERVAGFVLDGGPDSLPPGRPDAVRLVAALGVTLERAHDTSTPSILIGRRARRVPEGMGGFLPKKLGPLARTLLFSPLGKARMAADLVLPARRDDGDETLEQFVRRRLGGQAYRRLVEPVTSGVLLADPSRVSVLAVMPHLRAAEASHGSLIRAVLAGRRSPALRPAPVRAATPPPGPATPSPAPAAAPPPLPGAPAAGMAAIVDALASRLTGLGVDVRTGNPVTALSPTGSQWHATLGGVAETFDAVVVATPAPAAAALLATAAPEAADALAAIPQTTVTVVALGYSPDALDDRARRRLGTGHLVPADRHHGDTPVRAVWSTSARFPDHAPPGCHLLRVTIDGPPAGTDAVALARAHLARELGVDAEPLAVAVHRWDGVIPQYALGHRERVAAVDRALADRPGLAVAGSALRGAALADCVASGAAAAVVVAGVGRARRRAR